MPKTPIPRVVDIYHGDVMSAKVHRTDPIVDYKALGQAAIWGLIHKATQGVGVTDPAYRARRTNARLGGLLAGAYHFNPGDTIQDG
jgi:GH25 family lysozyme M1 (1,4-beta-N-acetylmuramidase)